LITSAKEGRVRGNADLQFHRRLNCSCADEPYAADLSEILITNIESNEKNSLEGLAELKATHGSDRPHPANEEVHHLFARGGAMEISKSCEIVYGDGFKTRRKDRHVLVSLNDGERVFILDAVPARPGLLGSSENGISSFSFQNILDYMWILNGHESTYLIELLV
jgi:hypothetical protein